MLSLKSKIFSSRAFTELGTVAERGDENVLVKNVPGALPVLVADYLYETTKRPVLLVAETLEDAEEFADDLTVLLGENKTSLFPGLPQIERKLSPVELSERAEVLMSLARNEQPLVIAPVSALLDPLPEADALEKNSYVITKGETLARDSLIEFLHSAGYTRETLVEGVGQYAVRGAVVDVYPFGSSSAVRIEYDDDVIFDLRTFDPVSQRSTGDLNEVSIIAAEDPGHGESHLLHHLPANTIIVWHEGRAAWNGLKSVYEERRGTAAAGRLFHNTPQPVPQDELDEDELRDIIYEEDEQIPEPEEFAPELPRNGKLIEPEVVRGAARKLMNVMLATTPFDSSVIVDVNASPQEKFAANLPLVADRLKQYHAQGIHSVILCDNELAGERLAQVLIERGCPETAFEVQEAGLRHGFTLPDENLAVLVDHDIFGRMRRRRRFLKYKNAVPLHDIDSLKPGDFVVHVDHGIGKYVGLMKIFVGGQQREVLKIEYKDGVNLFVKLESLAQVQKYTGREGFQPPLSKIGGRDWRELKRKTKKSLLSIAEDLLKLYAKRRAENGIAYPPDTPWQREMEASFPYEDTPDQLNAAEAVKSDMESAVPMDRLVCGDVGYGKTEVAMRAAFKAVTDGKQVAILVPTTILAQQHYRTFKERFSGWPITVRVMSRFQSAREQKETIKQLATGDVDVLIGTHRMLSKDVEFHDLGLLIIDEEHRFGVVQKEKIKSIRANIDVLAMSATPIPRTLHMALMGARDLSRIDTPPPGRLPIETDVVGFSEKVIKDAILYEVHRGGQVFFVHNRVKSIEHVREMIARLVPKVRIGVAHGQMDENELSKVMVDFIEGNFDVLISTMIIESGLDMPNVNTMIVNRADRFGVAQLHQLRGRIGRSSRKAYAYLLVPPHFEMSKIARERLAALTNFSSLGAGYQVAMRDLEIRGAGNLLGREQSGYINSVGFEMYQKLIEEAVREVQLEHSDDVPEKQPVEVRLKLEADAFFPEPYMPEGGQRLNYYREMSRAKTLERVDELEAETADRYGHLPEAAKNLYDMVRVRILGERLGAESVDIQANEMIIEFPLEGFSRESLLDIAAKSEGFPVEFVATAKVKLKLPLNKKKDWREKLSYVTEFLRQVTKEEETVEA